MGTKINIANVLKEQTFWVGDNADIEVVVNLYEYDGEYKITSWLRGVEELNTETYDGSSMSDIDIVKAMESLVTDNMDYILDVANWKGE